MAVPLLSLMLLVGAGLGIAGKVLLLREAQRLQKASDEHLAARSTLLRDAVQDMREPLNSIAGLMSSVRSNAMSTGRVRADLAEQLDGAIRSFNDVLGRTIDAFELARDGVPLKREPLDLRTKLKILIRQKSRMLVQQNRAAVLKSGHIPEMWMEADPDRLEQCLGAVLDEAVRRVPQGVIKVSSHREQIDGALFLVTVKFLCRPDASARSAMRGELSGAYKSDQQSVSLSLASRIADLMAGAITVKAEAGDCFSLVVSFETESCPPIEAEDGPPALPQEAYKTKSVLLVDDCELNLFVLQEAVMPLGFGEVVCVSGGHEAVRRSRLQAFDLILMDHIMPDLDGFDAAAAIRSGGASQGAGIILVSGAHHLADDRRIKAAGIASVLEKPLDRDDVVQAAEAALAALNQAQSSKPLQLVS